MKYEQAGLAEKEDYYLIKTDCHRVLWDPSTAFTVFEIFVGHNSTLASIYAKENLLNNVLTAIQQDISTSRDAWLHAHTHALVVGFVKTGPKFQHKGETLGTTARFDLVDGRIVIVASISDPSCMLLDTKGGVVFVLIVDHRLKDNVEERGSVKASGGEVGRLDVYGRCCRWPDGLS